MMRTFVQAAASGIAASMNRRRNPAKAPALTPTDMKAVTGVGAPSYTSGTQLWKGTAETLKAKPHVMSTRATTAIPLTPFRSPSDAPMLA